MTQVVSVPTKQPKSSLASWLVLILGSLGALLMGAAAQIGAYLAFGLCMEADEADCPVGTLPTTWEWAVATVPSYLLWVAPSAVLGYRVLQSGNRVGRIVMVVAGVWALLITVGCAFMWWL
jgi:hypothetical protein